MRLCTPAGPCAARPPGADVRRVTAARCESRDVLEVALLKVLAGQENDFEIAFRSAQAIIAASPGFLSHQLRRCVERPNQYILLVWWRTLDDHTVGFRGSKPYQEWKRLLHHFYDPAPTVEHYFEVSP